jgi:hypothetical protein
MCTKKKSTMQPSSQEDDEKKDADYKKIFQRPPNLQKLRDRAGATMLPS